MNKFTKIFLFSTLLVLSTVFISGIIFAATNKAQDSITVTVTDPTSVPVVTSPTDTNVTSTSAILGANVTSLGLPATLGAHGVYVSISPSPSTGGTWISGGSTGSFTVSVTGLIPGTTYYYRGYAANGTGTGYSSDGTFTTVAASKYTVSATAGTGGTISPASIEVVSGDNASFNIKSNAGYVIDKVTGDKSTGCGTGTLSGNTYTTGLITENCTVTATFKIVTGDSCGSLSGTTTPQATEPTGTDACAKGIKTSSPVDTSTEWKWSCGTVSTCKAPKLTDGSCFNGAANPPACTETGKWSTLTCSSTPGTLAYTLTATCSSPGTCSGVAPTKNCPTVPMGDAISIRIWPDSQTVTSGQKAKINWEASNADECSGSDYGWSPGGKTSGSSYSNPLTLGPANGMSDPLGQVKQFYIHCSNDTDTKTARTFVIVSSCPNTICNPNGSCINGANNPPTCNTFVPSGTLSATSCSISQDSNTCVSKVTWTTSNLSSGDTAVTRNNPNNTTVSSATSGTDVSSTINYGNSTFYLYHDGEELNKAAVTAACTTGTTWNTTSKTCKKDVVTPSCSNGATNPPTCTIGGGGSCLNGATNPPACTIKTPVDGYWSAWFPPINSCPSSPVEQTSTYTAAKNGGIDDPVGTKDGATKTQTISPSDCPTVDIIATRNNKELLSTEKIPYNGKVNISWTAEKAISCDCTYIDINNKTQSCGSGSPTELSTPYISPALKRSTTYKVSCNGAFGISISDEVKVLVADINADYIEN